MECSIIFVRYAIHNILNIDLVDLHAIVDENISVREGHEISHRLKDTLQSQIPEIGNVLIHIEPGKE